MSQPVGNSTGRGRGGDSAEVVGWRPMATASRLPGMQIDFVKLAWKSKWLLLLGLGVGLGLGYLHFTQTPPMFRSAARLQIIESSTQNLPVDRLEGGRSAARTLSDEALVMRSERILERASQMAQLDATPEFAGMSHNTIAMILAGSQGLVVGPAVETGATSVFQVSYDSPSGSTSQRVVQGVVDAYAAHLIEQYRNVGQETLELIQSARSEVLTKLTKLESEFEQYKRDTGLIYRDGTLTSIHRDNADRYHREKQTLIMNQTRLESALAAAKIAIDEARPAAAILMALSEAPTLSSRSGMSESELEIQKIRESAEMTLSERMRQERLLPLEMERQDMVDRFGSDHPAMQTLLNRIRLTQETIDKIAATEREVKQKVSEVIENAGPIASGEAISEAEMQERIRLRIFAMRQNLESIAEELRVVSHAYDVESAEAKEESAIEMKSSQFLREIARQQMLYDRIVARLDEVNLMADGGSLKVFPLDTAKYGYQFAPQMFKSLLMGGFLGTMLAAGIALLREISDRSYRSAREIAEHIRLPVIGHVPVLKRIRLSEEFADSKLDGRLCAQFNPKGSKAEAFRAIRTALYFSNQANGDRILQITSPTPGDGKSTIAANLAITIAQSGRSVLLIDADLRRPRMHRLFGVEAERGLAWAIHQIPPDGPIDDLCFAESIVETEVSNLSLMPAGQRPQNPAELLASRSFERLLDSLRGKFDMILIDSPPLLAVTDPSNIVRRADGVLMVIRLRKNVKPSVAQATRMLETLEANVLGVIVNGVGSRQSRGYGQESNSEGNYNYGRYYQYGYGYSYGGAGGKYTEYYDDDDSKRKTARQRGAKKRAVVETTSP